jgi:hypothetical protein
MKTIISFVSAFAILLTASSCYIDDDFFQGDCIRGIGGNTEATFKVPAFTGVLLTTDVPVTITQGSPQKIVVNGENNIIDALFLNVSRSVLEIGFTQCVKRHNLEIHLTMPDISYLSLASSGDFYGENFFDVPSIVLRNSGSGKINLGLYTDEVDGSNSGSGDIELEGDCKYLSMKSSGSGDLAAFKLEAEKANIQVSGSGDAAIWVSKVLDVRISGSGDVYYKGRPIINFNRTGSGDLVDAN